MFYETCIDPNLKIKDLKDVYALPEMVVVNKFNEDGVKSFREQFEKALVSKQEIIPVVIDSYGGEAYSVLAMVDIIKNSPVPVATIVSGKAMSCGAILFTCGTNGYRYVGPNATVLIHDVSSWMYGKIEDMKIDLKETKRLNKLVYHLMAENCGHHKDYFLDIIKEKGNRDWYLSPKECIKHNVANVIGSPVFKINIKAKVSFGCRDV
jgi:ATP-dependent Clp protease, protease subunit